MPYHNTPQQQQQEKRIFYGDKALSLYHSADGKVVVTLSFTVHVTETSIVNFTPEAFSRMLAASAAINLHQVINYFALLFLRKKKNNNKNHQQ